ncbi:hypothetical protein D0C16_11270 [Cellvibrio sp. KY-GH-1]|uniref:DUF7674 family protein n=1 Tax=Cellvibrio sp. KY-GH-1 TaxID=2303332 RepID=UPI001248F116|nr:hypothetical protein [Cellvibrio sp. KY-GH-1]QEY16508.1 hypothetical protein D0C16_11270 [Cellvibrio sp. KY-GH-1]
MSRDKFCEEVKAKFPAISAKADREYIRQWGDFETDLYSYSWFESLANALNIEMGKGIPRKDYQDLFSFVSNGFLKGDEDTKNAIDTAFVENLFWNVSSSASELYWNTLPENLKDLYLNFHRKKPY